ncbi:MAG: hypothetical protein ACRYFU_12115 [Janthinobacterium lividum]
MSFVFTLVSVTFVVGYLYVQAWRKKNRLSATTWEELVDRLQELPIIGITKVALDYLQPSKGQLSIQTDEMWLLIGGNEGLERMRANADILLQLAAYAEQWNREECVIVGERMRRESMALRRAVSKVQRGLLFGRGRMMGPFHVQEATSAYYLMRERLLVLYQTSHAGRYARLATALGNGVAAYGPAV